MKQLRNTHQRQMILDMVQTRRDHPSADQIYLDVRCQDNRISRGTVYRNLNMLADSGLIRRVKTPGIDRFDWRLEAHYHLLCTSCGKLCDAPIPYNNEIIYNLERDTGYKLELHRVIFEGTCPECLAKRSQE